jgi:integrase
MSLYKRGSVYWSYVYIDGVRHSKSTNTGNRRQAELVDQKFREELNMARHGIRQLALDMPFGECIALFLAEGSHKRYHLDRLKVLLPYFSETPIGRINRAMAQDYRRHRHAEKKLSETTVNRDIQALKHFLFWAVDEGLLAVNPLSRIRLVPVRRKPFLVLTLEDEAKLLRAAAPHLREIITVALDTGMRRGEILNQRWEHVDFSRGLLFVTKSKTAGGEGREIPFTDRVHDLLLAKRKEEGLLFLFQGSLIRTIKTAWKSAIRRAGIRYLRFHDLRHTFNTRLMEAGVMQEIRKALMGHSSGGDVNAMYTHVELPAKREAIRKLEAWVAIQTQTQLPRAVGSNVLRMREMSPSNTPDERREPLNVVHQKARDLL